MGHLHIALEASGVSAAIDAPAVPFLEGGVRALARAGMVPSGTRSNLEFVDDHVEWGTADEVERLMLADAQTSGGLLIAVALERAGALAAALEEHGVRTRARIGEVRAGRVGSIEVTGRPHG